MWQQIFGSDAPVEIEIGPGVGTFIVPAARARPHVNFFGIENARSRAIKLQALVGTQQLHNVRILSADARCVVRNLIPSVSVAAYHIYFPDPWWKRRHHHRRLFTKPFVAALLRTLGPGGRLYVATDVLELLTACLQTVAAVGGLFHVPHERSPRTSVTTFERKGLRRGAQIYEATFAKLPGRDLLRAQTSSAAPMTPAESPS
jgi:tRNA (guanine-N7-)-methyltransferase